MSEPKAKSQWTRIDGPGSKPRPGPSILSPDLFDQLRRRKPFSERDPDDLAAPRLDDIRSDNRALGPIGALHQDVGLKRGHDLVRRRFIEDDDSVDGSESRDEFGA